MIDDDDYDDDDDTDGDDDIDCADDHRHDRQLMVGDLLVVSGHREALPFVDGVQN